MARVKLDGLEDPAGPAAERGNLTHDLFERYVLALLAETEPPIIPSTLRTWLPQLNEWVEACDDVVPEFKVALTRNWRRSTWEKAAIRGKIDLLYTHPEREDALGIVDYKTGGIYPEHAEQLELYGVYGFVLFPWAVEVHAADWYLEKDHVEEKVFTREEFPALFRKWQSKVRRDLSRAHWPAIRNPWCKNCPFSSRRGGDCVTGG